MRVSNLGFGASSLGGVFRGINEAEAVKAVFAAVENGINFIDVSPYYGHLKAETVLGKALKDIPRDKYYLSTKVGRYGKDGVNTWDYSAKRATESVYESMERLNIDHIDLINVHDVEFTDLRQVAEETLPALVELREKGVVSHVGITDLQPENLKWLVENTPEGTIESILNFCHYCLNDDLLLDYLDSKKYSQEKLTGTVAGRMIAGTVEGEIEANNEFMNSGIEFVMKKTPKAKFSFGISYDNRDYAVWIDMFEGYYFITKKFPKNTEGKPIFTITASDAKINYIMAKRAEKPIQMLSDAFYMGVMRFDNMATMNAFLDLLTMFGIRR